MQSVGVRGLAFGVGVASSLAWFVLDLPFVGPSPSVLAGLGLIGLVGGLVVALTRASVAPRVVVSIGVFAWLALIDARVALFPGSTSTWLALCLPALMAALVLDVRVAVATFVAQTVIGVAFFVARVDSLSPLPLAFEFSHGFVVALVVLTTAMIFDLSRRQASAAERDANEAKSRFLANISHELRTPMHAMLGLTEVLLTSQLPKELLEHVRLMRSSGQLLTQLLNDLLDLSKIEAGRLTLERVEFSLVQLVTEISGLHEATAMEKRLTLRCVLEGDLKRMSVGDPLRIRQILSNLLSNALKFTERGTVLLRVRADEVTDGAFTVHFSVSDTGAGIAPEVLPRLFQRFEQAESHTSRRYGGTGLGLALCHELSQAMGGCIEVESELGAGSTFTFSVPLKVAPTSGGYPAASPIPEVAHAPTRPVLVVDDNPINLRVARALVEKLGFQVATASGGAEAVEKVRNTDYLCVLMDVNMPDVDGLEATRLIRALPGVRSTTPVVALTAAAMPEELERTRTVGMNGYLQKPSSMEALNAILERLRRGLPLKKSRISSRDLPKIS
jgi:signal transduction histidine kinase/ActR/RegA family two-component response regulator